MRLIDADALEKDYREDFERVYKHTRDAVNPADFYIERKAAYDKELVRMEMEAFCKYLQSRPAIDAVPVVHAQWILKHVGVGHYWECSACRTNPCIYVTENTKFCPNCGARMDGEADA